MNNIEIISECLRQISPASLEYDEWLNVGSAIKHEGGTCEMWDSWSRGDTRYREGEPARKWGGLDKGAAPVTIATIVKLCKDQGGTPPRTYHDDANANEAIPMDRPVFYDRKPESQESVKIIRDEWLELKSLPPEPKDWNGIQDLTTYLRALFDSNEYVAYVADAFLSEADQNGAKRWMPRKGIYSKTAGELIDALAKCKGDMGAVIGDWPKECGAWIRFNPFDGTGIADANVTDYRYALVESDDISIEKQYAIYKELELPVAALVYSGGKSLHAIVRIEAPDFKEYQKRVDFLYDVCKKNGLVIDRKNRNPSRLSRMPGVTRNGKKQWLVATNTGKESWLEWTDWIAAQNDDLPDVEMFSDYFQSPPPLAECLIEDVLRKGHKMLISGPSKAGKSFLLLELCTAIAEGVRWLGWQCRQGRVLYVNLELDRASCINRLVSVYDALKIKTPHAGNIDLWHLRGQSMGMDLLAPKLIRRAMKKKYSAVVIDPIYKVITGDENAADQMAKFCNQFDRVCHELKCAVIYCHHHSKGDQGGKRAMDRSSGSGVFARDPDALIDMVELVIDDARREQIINRSGCEAIEQLLTRSGVDWKSEIGQDDALVNKKMIEYAVKKVSPDLVIHAAEEAERAAQSITGWRIDGILREFPAFQQRNCFFKYPVHLMDADDLLKDAFVPGEIPQRKTKVTPIKPKQSKATSFRMAFDALNDGTPVTVKAMANHLNSTEQTIRNRMDEYGEEVHLRYSSEKGVIQSF